MNLSEISLPYIERIVYFFQMNFCRGKMDCIDCSEISLSDIQRIVHFLQMKFRKGKVDRIDSSGHAIIKDMFKRDTALAPFIGAEVLAPCGTAGKIIASFGKSGKVRVDFGYEHSVRGGHAVVMRIKKPVSTKL